MKRINARLWAAVLAIGLAPFTPTVCAASQDQEPSAPQQPSQPDQPAPEVQAFSGRIAKNRGQYVLRDTRAKITYELDDQDKARSFNGKQVKVIGALDEESNVIHVADIRPAA